MAETKELKKIKKKYGEKFKNLCRDLFPIIIEEEGTLLSILEKRFSDNCNSLYETITENGLEVDFKEYIFSEFDLKREGVIDEEVRTPYEILDEAGYDLIECKTEEEIQSFKKYYAQDEVLCTIYNGGRLQTRDCFFAVRKDVDNIKREDFKIPNKEDEYSTSVLGIQFTRDRASTVQIISRYNHTVSNPNCTLGNDLDRLAPGLSQSFGRLLEERGLTLSTENKESFRIPGYTLASDGRYYKYNTEIGGNYYCPGNIVISNGIARSVGEPEKGLLIDNFYIDFENKTVEDKTTEGTLDYEHDSYRDSFIDAFKNIEKIEVEKSKAEGINKVIKVYMENAQEPAIIEIDKDNQIVGYENSNITSVGDYFLENNTVLRRIELPNLKRVGDYFLGNNREMTELELPNLQQTGNCFLELNEILKSLKLPKLQKVGVAFLLSNKGLTELELNNLEKAGYDFLLENSNLISLEADKLREVGDGFLLSNEALKELKLPSLVYAGCDFLYKNKVLSKLELPSLEYAGGDFLCSNIELTELEMKNLHDIEYGFLSSNEVLKKLELPNLKVVEDKFLANNKELIRLVLPNLQVVGDYFLELNEKLEELEILNVKEVGDGFACSNKGLKKLDIPNIKKVGDGFVCANEILSELRASSLIKVGNYFFSGNKRLKRLELLNLKEAGDGFLDNNKVLEELRLLALQKVGDGFLGNNEVLTELESPNLEEIGAFFLDTNINLVKVSIPKRPDIEESFREITEKNTAKGNKTLIDEINEKRGIVKEQEEEIEKLQEEKKMSKESKEH